MSANWFLQLVAPPPRELVEGPAQPSPALPLRCRPGSGLPSPAAAPLPRADFNFFRSAYTCPVRVTGESDGVRRSQTESDASSERRIPEPRPVRWLPYSCHLFRSSQALLCPRQINTRRQARLGGGLWQWPPQGNVSSRQACGPAAPAAVTRMSGQPLRAAAPETQNNAGGAVWRGGGALLGDALRRGR